jgi:hypothetical protein
MMFQTKSPRDAASDAAMVPDYVASKKTNNPFRAGD